MMKKVRLINAALAAVLLTSFASHAQWLTKVDDDLFTGGKKALMIGDLSSSNSGLIFDCTKNKLSVAYVETDKSSDSVPAIAMDLIIKVDGNPANKLEASLSRRNAQAIEVSTDDAEKITAVLKQLQNAKSKVLVGIQTQDGGNQSSFSGNASGSTAATNSFIKACEISL
ncbi:hypothetical protein [Klebsiella pneumoniae]|uniref:hypothetical protein n=1 Tax=Klebsiella pneumoniae TaxID=573 RepID=UPI002FF20EB7